MVGILRTSFMPSLSRTASPAPSPPLPNADVPTTNSPEPAPELSLPAEHSTSKSSSSNLVEAAKRSVSSSGASRKLSKEGSGSSAGSMPANPSQLGNPVSEPGRARASSRGDSGNQAVGHTSANNNSSNNNKGSSAQAAADGGKAAGQPLGRNLRSFLTPSSRSSSPGVGAQTPPASASAAAAFDSNIRDGGPNAPGMASRLNEPSLVSRVAEKLSDLVNRAFPPDPNTSWNGRSPAKPETLRKLGDAIVTELQNASSDHYLLRSLLRSAILRNLTIFMGRLESLPQSEEIVVPKTVKEVSSLPAGQRYNLENVRSAYELRAALYQVCEPASDPRSKALPSFVADALRPWIIKIDNYITRLMNPVVLAIKLSALHQLAAAQSSLVRTTSAGKVPDPATTPMTSAQPTLPTYLRDLAAQLEAAGQLFRSLRGGKAIDRWIVNIGSFLIWKAMLYYACRQCPPPARGVSTAPPKATPTSSRGKSLPLLRNNKRGHSPPPLAAPEHPHDRLVSEVAAFRAIISNFATPVLKSPAAPNEEALRSAKDVHQLCESYNLLPEIPSDDEGSQEEVELAHEAMHEALLALGAFELALRALKWPEELTAAFLYDDDDSSSSDDEDPARTPSAVFRLTGPGSPATRVAAEKARNNPQRKRLIPVKMPDPTLDRALDTLPPVITFHMLASRLQDFRLPHEIWDLPGGWEQYDSQLHGFSAGDNFKEEVGWEMVAELDRIRSHRPHAPEDTWEGLLRCAVKCEVGL